MSIRAVDTIRITNQSTIRISDFELGILEGNAGIYGTHLTNQEVPIRSIVKTNCDDTLLTAVCQVHGFGGIDDAVPVCRVHLFDDICTAF